MKGSSQGELRPTKDNIQTQLKRLLADVGKNDMVLVMLCGHGQQLEVTQARRRDTGGRLLLPGERRGQRTRTWSRSAT